MSSIANESNPNDPSTKPEITIGAFTDMPDQFTKYDSMTYDPTQFYTSSGEFNLALFNKTFREEQIKRIQFYRKQEEDKLNRLNAEPPAPDFANLSVGQHIFNMKDSVFNTVSDLASGKPLSSSILTKNNRLFYFGLLLVIIFIVYLVLANLVSNVR
jgi:hypothetical protein